MLAYDNSCSCATATKAGAICVQKEHKKVYNRVNDLPCFTPEINNEKLQKCGKILVWRQVVCFLCCVPDGVNCC